MNRSDYLVTTQPYITMAVVKSVWPSKHAAKACKYNRYLLRGEASLEHPGVGPVAVILGGLAAQLLHPPKHLLELVELVCTARIVGHSLWALIQHISASESQGRFSHSHCTHEWVQCHVKEVLCNFSLANDTKGACM